MDGQEVVAWLQEMIRIDTRNPPGNEAALVDWLGATLAAEGVPWSRIDHAPGRSSFVARLEGSDDSGPFCLVSHLDTAPVERDRWSVDPLAGEIRDGHLWGRGALDMKGMLAVQLAAVVDLQRRGLPLRRDVVLLAVADEEAGSIGMQEVISRHWADIGCTEALNEGGLGLVDALFVGQTLHAVSVAERGVLWLELVATADAGHGSVDRPDEALDRLLGGVARVARLNHRPRMDPAIRELLRAAGRQHGGLAGAVLRSDVLVSLFVRPRLLADPALRAALTDSVHLTGIRAGEAPNVVPGSAVATFDGRLLPGTDPDALLARLQRATSGVDGLAWRVLQSVPARGNGWDSDTFRAIVAAASASRSDVAVGPALSVGFTDSLWLRTLGVDAYGWVPFEVTPELAATMHGADERVPVEEVVRGAERMAALLAAVALDGG